MRRKQNKEQFVGCVHLRSNHFFNRIFNKIESVSIPTIIGETTDKKKTSCSPK